jgi:hypothetical protein
VARPERARELDQLDWWTFVCVGCGETIWVGHDSDQDVVQFASMCRTLYGDPPVCTECQRRARLGL